MPTHSFGVCASSGVARPHDQGRDALGGEVLAVGPGEETGHGDLFAHVTRGGLQRAADRRLGIGHDRQATAARLRHFHA